MQYDYVYYILFDLSIMLKYYIVLLGFHIFIHIENKSFVLCYLIFLNYLQFIFIREIFNNNIFWLSYIKTPLQ